MATEECFQHGVANLERDDGGSPSKKVDLSAATTSDTLAGCFDCNICLDNAHDPVVTLCGHLYCWPCIYQWIHFQGASITPEEQQQCPVCKAGISHTTLVPLYGRGQSSHDESKDQGSLQGLDIPSRPRGCGVDALITTTTSTSPPSHTTHRNPYRSQSQPPQHQHFQNRFGPPTPVIPTPLHPMIGMFGEMFYTRIFVDSSPNLRAHRRGRSVPYDDVDSILFVASLKNGSAYNKEWLTCHGTRTVDSSPNLRAHQHDDLSI
ncbi:hypothetical protein IFM89_011384 [Coptis chinensis]|uniref:E3 ubiquitin-protein ligase RMA n=1 Tax=Coptis chinensis TaxID=261450 RepID=A0A835LM48_9MAGN|nr:hypothetical protein IFM89_011384 [Coptis chinensis]